MDFKTKRLPPIGNMNRPAGVLDNPNFRRWFGNSKVVNHQGNPLVVYHGTRPGNDITQFRIPNDRDGVYFTPDASYADGFTNDLRGDTGQAGPIYPVYLSVKNPYVVRADHIDDDAAQSFLYRGLNRTELENQGYDGAMLYLEGELDQVVVFNHTQIKSTTAALFRGCSTNRNRSFPCKKQNHGNLQCCGKTESRCMAVFPRSHHT